MKSVRKENVNYKSAKVAVLTFKVKKGRHWDRGGRRVKWWKRNCSLAVRVRGAGGFMNSWTQLTLYLKLNDLRYSTNLYQFWEYKKTKQRLRKEPWRQPAFQIFVSTTRNETVKRWSHVISHETPKTKSQCSVERCLFDHFMLLIVSFVYQRHASHYTARCRELPNDCCLNPP